MNVPPSAAASTSRLRKSQQVQALHQPNPQSDRAGHSALHDELVEGLREALHRLPAQGPIAQFVHHNTLHAQMDRPFWQAVREVAKGSEAKTLPSEADAREAWLAGRIDLQDLALALGIDQPPQPDGQLTPTALRWIAARWGLAAVAPERLAWWQRGGQSTQRLIESLPPEVAAPAPAPAILAVYLQELVAALRALPPQAEWDGPALATPRVCEEDRVWQVILAAWLDEGMAALSMAENHRPIHLTGARLIQEAELWRMVKVPRQLLADWLRDKPSGIKALEQVLQHIRPEDPLHTAQAALLARPGWSGQAVIAARRRHRSVEDSRGQREQRDLDTAAGIAALRLALCGSELDPAEHRAPQPEIVTAWRLLRAALAWQVPCERVARLPLQRLDLLRQALAELDGGDLLQVLLQARELHHARVTLGALKANCARPIELRQPSQPWCQVVACIDDREEGLRRHLEELDSSLETLGVAGFFGAAMAWRGLDDATPSARCPVVMAPEFAVDEVALHGHASALVLRRRLRGWYARLRLGLHQRGRGSLYGVASLTVAGFLDGLRWMAAAVMPDTATSLRESTMARLMPPPKTGLQVTTLDGAPVAPERAATVVAELLVGVGIAQRMAPLVLLLGHRAQSANNPHVSAYGCGACSGNPGGPNARLVARWANDGAVRAVLAKRGIGIPDGTWFMSAEHETTGDAVVIYDLEDLPAEHRPLLLRLQRTLEEACGRSAVERCRRFELAPLDPLPAAARGHAHKRTVDPLEPRPELNHAANAVCVVGPRHLTRGLFLDRRAFLTSYEPDLDCDGQVLAGTLAAVVPVCGGINLEYFFSRNDPAVFGAGTKLPHNPVAGLAVQDGTAGDLRTGLPIQMTELHDPVRLLLVIAAPAERLQQVLDRHPGLRQWIAGGWVRTVTFDVNSGMWQAAAFPREIPPPERCLAPNWSIDSLARIHGQRDLLDPSLLGHAEEGGR